MTFRVEAKSLPANIEVVLDKLRWMRQQRIWPNGLRYLWTDAFGLVLLVSLHRQLGDRGYLDEAEWLVGEVDRVLGRARGIRIGEAADRDGQYFHYLAKWLFALGRLGRLKGEYRNRAIALAHDIHRAFVIPGMGVIWKMTEDLSGPYPGFGLGSLDAFDGYVVYRLLDEQALASEIAEMCDLVERDYRQLSIDQDLGLGMMLWLAHFLPRRAMGESADPAVTRHARSHVDRSSGLFLPQAVAAAGEVCVHELRDFPRSAGRATPSRSRGPHQGVLRRASIRRRIRQRGDYSRHGLRIAFSRRIPSSQLVAGSETKPGCRPIGGIAISDGVDWNPV